MKLVSETDALVAGARAGVLRPQAEANVETRKTAAARAKDMDDLATRVRLTDSRINCRARQPDPARRTPELPRGR